MEKFSIDSLTQVGSGSSSLDSRDEDFGQVFGNLIWAGDDHAVGTVLLLHQTTRDINRVEVGWIHPGDGAIDLALTTWVGSQCPTK